VSVEKVVYVEKEVEVPVEKVVYVEKEVEVPVEKVVYVEKEVEVPVEKVVYVEKEVIKEVPVDRVVYVDRPVIKQVEKSSVVYVDRPVIKEVEKPVYIERVPQPVDRVLVNPDLSKYKVVETPMTRSVYVERREASKFPERGFRDYADQIYRSIKGNQTLPENIQGQPLTMQREIGRPEIAPPTPLHNQARLVSVGGPGTKPLTQSHIAAEPTFSMPPPRADRAPELQKGITNGGGWGGAPSRVEPTFPEVVEGMKKMGTVLNDHDLDELKGLLGLSKTNTPKPQQGIPKEGGEWRLEQLVSREDVMPPSPLLASLQKLPGQRREGEGERKRQTDRQTDREIEREREGLSRRTL